MLENVRANRYNHTKLLNDVISAVLGKEGSTVNFAIGMKCDLDGTMEQLEICNDHDVRTMFERNRRYMEVNLHVDICEAVPLAIDTTCEKKICEEINVY